ncbi:MAG: hypothetical protein KDD61_13880 [Bdellovibrionales bacterium]|nr:hypothetical protein [Bdellovibrionales bacterium]
MNVKLTLLLYILLISFQPTWASDYHADQNSIQDLAEKDLEVEIATEDFFDEEASAKESKELRAKYTRETKNLEGKISQLNRKSNRLRKNQKSLNTRFDKSYATFLKVQSRANKEEAKTNKLQTSVDRLQSKVDDVEQKAIASKNKIQEMQATYNRELRRRSRLTKRKKTAERIIIRNKKKTANLKRKLSSLVKDNAKLEAEVDRKEQRALNGSRVSQND